MTPPPPRPILLVTRKLPDAVEARAAASYDARLSRDDSQLSPDQLVNWSQGAAAILCATMDRFDARLIASLPASVRVIGTFSVGYEHIDVAAAAARGIAVCNTPDVLSDATAEIALLLILAACRRATEGERLLRAGTWDGWKPTGLIGQQVSGRALGILGMGRIGQALARMAAGLGMPIHYRNRTRLPEAAERALGATWHDSDESFLAASAVLSLHAPGGAATWHWLDARRLALLPPGAVVINTGRGTLVDDAALIAALHSGRIAAAGLDVFEGEPNFNKAYLTAPNAVLLPHMGSATTETRHAMGMKVLDGIDAILAGTTPDNLVRP